MTNKLKAGGWIEGIARSSSTCFVNLQYADDTLHFGKCDVRQATIMRWLIVAFELWSGLKDNFRMSTIIFIGKCDIQRILVTYTIGCSEGSFPIKYLGLPLKPERLDKQDWDRLTDRIVMISLFRASVSPW